MNPVTHEEEFARLLLGPMRLPGRVTLSGHTDSTAWDVKDGEGVDGAATTRKGKKPKPFTATLELAYDPTGDNGTPIDEIAAWYVAVPFLQQSKDAATPAALDVYHPDLLALNITSVVITDIGGLKHDGKGGATVAITLLPYAPPKPKKATGPNGSKGGGGHSTGDHIAAHGEGVDPLAQRKAELERLRKEAEKL
jgi:hypothetical protein